MEEISGKREGFSERIPFWEHLSEEEQKSVSENMAVRSFRKNQVVNSSDSACMGVVFILSGEIRVSLMSDEGREITLYRLKSGEYCVTTASCVIRQITFDTLVTASADTELLIIPASLCQTLTERNIYVRAFVFETETERFSQAIWVIQQMLFKRFDQRLAAYFVSIYEKYGRTDLKITQEEVARDVNSAREVVARMLHHFAADGLVEVTRGHIILRNLEGLRALL